MRNNTKSKKLKIQDINEALIESTIKTFEEMAFIDVEHAPDDNGVTFSQILYIGILNPVKGGMALYLPYECKKNILENIYGDDFNNLASKEIDDCLLEILNVMAGRFLVELFAPGVRYRVDIPKVIFDEDGIELEGEKRLELYFNAEGDRFKVAVAVQ